jgi:hypothetical protein
MTQEEIALVALTALESAHAFSAFLPSYFTIGKFAKGLDSTEADIHELRTGYVPAVLLSLGMGGLVSLIMKNILPLLACIGVDVIMVGLYEAKVSGRI